MPASEPFKPWGSSPHARRSLRKVHAGGRRQGIIPACAGSTSRSRSSHARSRDHPRIRGEHTSRWMRMRRSWGSSPHARGTLHPLLRDARRAGFIPACAGSTSQGAAWCRAHGDHPRMRGEHDSPKSPMAVRTGSSPHARGARVAGRELGGRVGIIPAYAGSTCARRLARSGCGGHPRMRGEHSMSPSSASASAGSSPHARGAQSGILSAHLPPGIIPACAGALLGLRLGLGLGPRLGRIIPACAGSTWALPSRGRAARDHPRMRGEHRVSTSSVSPSAGIIPACAGSTFALKILPNVDGNHPRMRGEHPAATPVEACVVGSSPHARGARITRPIVFLSVRPPLT